MVLERSTIAVLLSNRIRNMNQQTAKVTRVSISADYFRSSTSTRHGHNLNAIAFNLDAIAQHYPRIAAELAAIGNRLPILVTDASTRSR